MLKKPKKNVFHIGFYEARLVKGAESSSPEAEYKIPVFRHRSGGDGNGDLPPK
ncbi:hypothetical protein [Pseudoalteromonas sp. R3]|uniref:hypothetical protein n=1 Tax=Pseudoalteromonas sp. R3 TaxID=1709477 RepID=UPI000A83A88B|nr:hypothetical protein [Pseudoalteromonas sp. R3]